MSRPYQTSIGSFTRKSTFFWASVGATVGLANLWQFPYLASHHGGGLFLLVYLACLLLVTLPLMVTEAAFGRYARHGLVLALDGLVSSARCSRGWMLAGRLGIFAAFLVLSYTAVFGAIGLAYVFQGAVGRFSGGGEAGAAAVLAELVSDPGHYRQFMAWHAFFLVLVVTVSARGVRAGLERSLRLLVPTTLVLMLALFLLAATVGRLDLALDRVLGLHWQDLSWTSVSAALFQAFYTLGLGMGVWTILGAYTAPRTRFKRSLLATVLMDTLVAILAGLTIFALTVGGASAGDAHGFSLLFVLLPASLAPLAASQFLLAAMYLLVVLIVWATALALMEPVVAWLREWTGAPRLFSSVLVGVAVWAAGLLSLLSFNLWADVRLGGATVFRWLELVSGGVLVPVVAVLVSVFAGWCLTRRLAHRLIGETPAAFAAIWYGVLRWVLPVAVVAMGCMYSVASLESVCDAGAAALWCDRGEPLQVPGSGSGRPGDGGDGTAAPAVPGPLEPVPASPGEGADAPENAPNDDEILYHSV
ncbi:sodium-dependent transporter [Marinobacter lutaoensis]|jgi:NSS family neurotransmitter:Na+ symporter|uniref:Sodium-dependent transporter n=1 Tax=Marinobacter lutaoensis TaxID=135739 RepID=A0A1V2DSM9_9GAMM|nr:sodium-dependent transporter [Marinobacter lutaoensis]ONF43617.1 sodium-dependent transporter [Marinobacter lutaoensis]